VTRPREVISMVDRIGPTGDGRGLTCAQMAAASLRQTSFESLQPGAPKPTLPRVLSPMPAASPTKNARNNGTGPALEVANALDQAPRRRYSAISSATARATAGRAKCRW
jgi:hypothetical protein